MQPSAQCWVFHYPLWCRPDQPPKQIKLLVIHFMFQDIPVLLTVWNDLFLFLLSLILTCIVCCLFSQHGYSTKTNKQANKKIILNPALGQRIISVNISAMSIKMQGFSGNVLVFILASSELCNMCVNFIVIWFNCIKYIVSRAESDFALNCSCELCFVKMLPPTSSPS